MVSNTADLLVVSDDWMDGTFSPEDVCDASATNSVGGGSAYLVGARLVLVERSDGTHETNLYESPGEAAKDWPFYVRIYGERDEVTNDG